MTIPLNKITNMPAFSPYYPMPRLDIVTFVFSMSAFVLRLTLWTAFCLHVSNLMTGNA